MPSAGKQRTPRCLLCAMHCRIGATTDRLGYVRSVFPCDLSVERGACVRGVTAARVMSAENRVFTPRVDGAAAELDAALDALIARLRSSEDDAIAVMVDVNRPLEGIAAVASLRRAAGAAARVCAFVPPQDVPFVAAGAGPSPPFGELEACDLVVSIGDVCSTHPAIAWRLRDMQRAERQNRWISVDTAPGRSTRAADQGILVGPNVMAAFVAALAEDGADGEAGAVADALEGAEKPALVVSCSLGRYGAPAAVLAAARKLAKARGARLWALPTCTNALALPALQRELGLQGMSDVLQAIEAGSVKALLVLGFDPSAALPQPLWRGWVKACGTVAWGGSLECRFAEEADVVLPLALPWEESGTVLSVQGAREASTAWQPPPQGVPSIAELVGMIASRAGVPRAAAPSLEGIQAQAGEAAAVGMPAVADLEDAQVILVGAPEPHACTGGLSLAGERWQVRLASEERALCSASSWPGGYETREGFIAVGGEAGATVPARMAEADGWLGRVAALPDHWPILRELLKWSVAAGVGPQAEPAAVTLSKGE